MYTRHARCDGCSRHLPSQRTRVCSVLPAALPPSGWSALQHTHTPQHQQHQQHMLGRLARLFAAARSSSVLQPRRVRFSSAAPHTPTHYEVLGVARSASQAEVKQAFRARAKQLHPDSLNAAAADSEAFLRLVAAFEVLSDEQQRRLYNAATDEALPHALRKAAAAQQEAGGGAHTPGQQSSTDSDAFQGGCGMYSPSACCVCNTFCCCVTLHHPSQTRRWRGAGGWAPGRAPTRTGQQQCRRRPGGPCTMRCSGTGPTWRRTCTPH
jgi:hypothetical protein